jgi:nicotinamidase-related amidase
MTALIVVDMQNDFVRVGAPLEVPDARETIDVHLELLGWFRAQGRR